MNTHHLILLAAAPLALLLACGAERSGGDDGANNNGANNGAANNGAANNGPANNGANNNGANNGAANNGAANNGAANNGPANNGVEPNNGGPIDDPPIGDTDTLPAEVAAAMTGAWAIESTSTIEQDVPFTGWTASSTISYGLATIDQQADGTFTLTERRCRVRTTAGAGPETSIEDAVPRSMGETTIGLTFDQAANGTWRWYAEKQELAVGYEPNQDPPEDPPGSASDPRIIDQDQDGHPGVTVSIGGIITGDVYVAQVIRASRTGVVSVDGAHTGSQLDHGSTQVVLAATNPILEVPVPSRPVLDEARNPVRFARVDANLDCDGLVGAIDRLFPAR